VGLEVPRQIHVQKVILEKVPWVFKKSLRPNGFQTNSTKHSVLKAKRKYTTKKEKEKKVILEELIAMGRAMVDGDLSKGKQQS
jgi:hypothetical protein